MRPTPLLRDLQRIVNLDDTSRVGGGHWASSGARMRFLRPSGDGGQTWQPSTTLKSNGVSSFISPQQGWVWSLNLHNTASSKPIHGQFYRTVDNGATWSGVDSNVLQYMKRGQDIQQLDFVDAEYGWAWTVTTNLRRTQLLRTANGGSTWDAVDATVIR